MTESAGAPIHVEANDDRSLPWDWLRRIDRWQEQQQKTQQDVNGLQIGLTTVQRDIGQLGLKFDALVTRWEERSKTNWPMLGLLVALLPLSLGGLGFFVTSYTQGALAPINATMATLQESQKQIAESLKDVAAIQGGRGKEFVELHGAATSAVTRLNELETQVRDLDHDLAEAKSAIASNATETRVHIGEIEEQFHSVSNLENLRAAWNNRMLGMLFEKTHPGEQWHTDSFFPTSIFQGGGGAPVIPFTDGVPHK